MGEGGFPWETLEKADLQMFKDLVNEQVTDSDWFNESALYCWEGT